MALVKSVEMRIITDDAQSQAKLDKITAKAEKLRKLNPEIKVKIDAAEASAKLRVLREEIKRATREATVTIDEKVGKGGLIGRLLLGSEFAGGGSNKIGGLEGAVSNLPLGGLGGLGTLTAALPAIGALLVEVTGLVAGLSAATAGVGAFGLLALPTFKTVTNAYTTLDTAQKNYNNAVALNKENPTKTNAAAAAAALVKLRVAQESMRPSTRAAVTGIHDLIGEFDKLAKAFQPTVMKVFNDGLKVASTLLPHLAPLASAFGGALDGLLRQVDRFANSKGFKDWLTQFGKLVGPSVTAIGQGIGKVIVAFGKLLTVMSAHDVVHSINIAFDVLAGTIRTVSWVVVHLMHNWDDLSSGVAKAWHAVVRVVAIGALAILGVFRSIVDGAAMAFGWIPGIGPRLRAATGAVDRFVARVNASLSGIISPTVTVTANLVYRQAGFPGGVGPGSTGVGVAPPPRRASGGWSSGLIMTGEQGRELVRVPAGSYVYNHAQTEAIVAGRGGGGSGRLEVVLHFQPTGDPVMDAIGRGLRGYVRRTGGGGPHSVQRALGQVS